MSRDFWWLYGRPHRLRGRLYRDFLLHDLPKLLEDVPLAVRARMWYMHDGAPAHFSRAGRDVLSNTYHNRWIGREGPNAWPHPLDFCTWGHLKFFCMQFLLTIKRHFTIALCTPARLSATAPAYLNGCGVPWWDVSRCALYLMENILSTCYNGTFAALSHILKVFGHMLVWIFFLVLVYGTPHLAVTFNTYMLQERWPLFSAGVLEEMGTSLWRKAWWERKLPLTRLQFYFSHETESNIVHRTAELTSHISILSPF
jgi:hypothetical protein